jgi:hypothetical protein
MGRFDDEVGLDPSIKNGLGTGNSAFVVLEGNHNESI